MKTSKILVLMLLAQALSASANLQEATYPEKEELKTLLKRLETDAAVFSDIRALLQTNQYARIRDEKGNHCHTYYNLYYYAIKKMIEVDGNSLVSFGDSAMLGLTRDFIAEVESEHSPAWLVSGTLLLGSAYLAMKGDGRDIPTLAHCSQLINNEHSGGFRSQAEMRSWVLQSRVAGTNLLTGNPSLLAYSKIPFPYEPRALLRWCSLDLDPPLIPSVANTGPQAAYVHDLLKQAIAKYGNATNIPPELITLVVSFDAEGKPVCNIDLSRYGLVMPDLKVFGNQHSAPSATVITNAPSAEPPQEPIPALPAKEKVPAVPLILGMGVLAGLLLVVRFLKRR